MKKLRILVAANVPPDPNAGAAGTVYQMNRALRELGHDVDEIWATDLGRRIKHGNLHYLLELPRTYRREMLKRLSTKRYDVLEFNQPHAYAAAITYRRLSERGIFVNRSHGHEIRSEEALAPWQRRAGILKRSWYRRWLSEGMRRLIEPQWRKIARVADGFVVSCSEDAQFLVDRYRVSTERIGVITQGVPEPFIATEAEAMTPERLKRVLYVGQFAFFKAPHILAETVNRILSQAPDATMTWVCGQSHHGIVTGLLDEGVRSRVTMIDWMPQNELIRTLDQHGVFLFPSFFEGFGKTPLEAMTRGLCVVASRAGGMRDYIQHGVNGYLEEVGDADAFAKTALRLMRDIGHASDLSRAARLTANEHTWLRCARDATAFYEHLIELKNHARELPSVSS